jgi:putative PIG3 family NAD(P)H quinone oxidoreductase
MRAIDIIQQTDTQRLVLNEHTRPTPASHQVLIKVAAAGINRPDILQRRGAYPAPADASPILGLEVAGSIVEIGSQVKSLKPGDKVCALVNGGGYAEYCVASETSCLPIPNGLTFVQAAALPETFFTVWSNVFDRGKLLPGETLLVHGGTSGIGTTAIQMAKAMGSLVVATAGSDEKCHHSMTLGAHAAINYRKQDFVKYIDELTNGRGVDVILDIVGGDYFSRNLKALATEGRLLQIGIQQGAKSDINLWQVMQKRLIITGSTLRGRSDDFKAQVAQQLHTLIWPMLESGQICPIIDSVFPLADAEQAHARMLSNLHIGKIILEI